MAKFKKGQSGNPAGRKPGQRNKATLAVVGLLEKETEALTKKAVEMALEGDTAALRLCIERLAPPAKERPIQGFKLPQIEAPADVLVAINTVSERLASGELLPSEAGAVAGVLDHWRKHFETSELDRRLTALEEAKQ